MRIVAGKHRGRKLAAPDDFDIRPTSDRARETLFNMLAHSGYGDGGASPLLEARVLDACCGTGALGLEALSRGANEAVFLDRDRRALKLARKNTGDLNETDRADFIPADATMPPRAEKPCDIFFLDPPYGAGLAETILAALAGSGWLKEGAIGVVETGRADDFTPPAGFTVLKTRDEGAAKITFLRYDTGAEFSPS